MIGHPVRVVVLVVLVVLVVVDGVDVVVAAVGPDPKTITPRRR